MAYDKLVDSAKLDGALKSTADAIRAKTGGTENIPWSETEGFKSAVEGITAGSGGGSTSGDGSSVVIENVVNLAVEVIVCDNSRPSGSAVLNMNEWWRNQPAANAYTSISYDATKEENICQYTGVGLFEVIGIPLVLEAGKTYTFTVQFYTPNTITGDYANPYAPYIAFIPFSAFGTDADPYPSVYAFTKLALSTADYIEYSVTYTPGSTVLGGAAFVMGSTTDGVPCELRLKNINLSIV